MKCHLIKPSTSAMSIQPWISYQKSVVCLQHLVAFVCLQSQLWTTSAVSNLWWQITSITAAGRSTKTMSNGTHWNRRALISIPSSRSLYSAVASSRPKLSVLELEDMIRFCMKRQFRTSSNSWEFWQPPPRSTALMPNGRTWKKSTPLLLSKTLTLITKIKRTELGSAKVKNTLLSLQLAKLRAGLQL